MTTFASFFKEMRVKKGKTLRQFCLENNLDPGNISKLERGVLPPPESSEKLASYARALGIVEGSDEWYEFFDLATVARGQVPAAIMSNEQLVARLPIVFRTLEGKRVTPEQVDDLIALIRKNEGYVESGSTVD
jgi:transcriptional regulator with XRE-family HTH domain